MIVNFALSLLTALLFFQLPAASPAPKETPKSTKTQVSAGTKNKKAVKVEAPPPAPDAAVSPTPSPCPYTVEEAADPPMVVRCIHSAKDKNFEHVIFMNKSIERGNNVTVPILGLKTWISQSKDHTPHDLRSFFRRSLIAKR